MSNTGLKRDTSTSSTRIRHPKLLRAIQTLWLALFILNAVVLLANYAVITSSLLGRCEQPPCIVSRLTSETMVHFEQVGVPYIVVALYRPLLDFMVQIIYIGLAVLIYRRSSNDWMSLLVSAALFLVGPRLSGVNVSLNQLVPTTRFVGFTMISLMYGVSLTALYLFPTGKFVPRWSWMVLLTHIVSSIVGTFILIVQVQTPTLGLSLLNGGLILIGVGFQFYRYRYFASPTQRQQSKLVIAAIACLVLGQLLRETAVRVAPNLEGSLFVLVTMGGYISAYLLALGLPVAIASAVLRYRLWDADLVINRSLVYSFVTLGMALIFTIALFVVDVALRTIFGTQDGRWSLIAATAVVVACYNPVRRQISRVLDVHIYGFRVGLDAMKRNFGHDETVMLPRTEQVAGTRSGGTAGELRLENLLGRGGMGEVYLGRHVQTGQAFAVKMLPRELAGMVEALERFDRESRLLVNLKHPNIIKTYGAGQTHHSPYYVMEYIDGRTLSERLKTGGAMPFEVMVAMLNGIASALDTAHAAGVIHRDVKPSNILLRLNDGISQPILTDFGIAKLTNDTAPSITRSTMMGTLDYVAPEQIMTAREVNHRADIYSLGVVAYQMMTGATPFNGGPGQLVFAHLNKPAPDPRRLNPSLSDDAAQAVMRAMSKRPDERFASAGAFARALTPDH